MGIDSWTVNHQNVPPNETRLWRLSRAEDPHSLVHLSQPGSATVGSFTLVKARPDRMVCELTLLAPSDCIPNPPQ
jgi:hypothetical protein